jgi:hypothetical protein
LLIIQKAPARLARVSGASDKGNSRRNGSGPHPLEKPKLSLKSLLLSSVYKS